MAKNYTVPNDRQYSKFSTIEVGTDLGDHVYLKSTGTPINIEIYTKVTNLEELLNSEA